MRGSVCQAKLVSAFGKIEQLRNFSSPVLGGWSMLAAVGNVSKWEALALHRGIVVKYV